MIKIFSIIVLSLIIAFSVMAYEEANYEVVKQNKVYEIRKYSDRLAIETITSNQGSSFRKLFNYISGNNENKEEISMTTPVTQVEKKAVIESALMSGVREVSLVDEPMAAAIGADIPVHKAEGNMVIDIGGGTSDIAIISLSAIAYGESIRLAGDSIDEAIVRYIRLNHHLSIGIFEGEKVKIEIGSAYPTIDRLTTEVKGLNVKTGVPTSVLVSDDEIRLAMQEPISTIITILMKALEKTPPELSADIHSNGIYLTGGGALIRGLDKLIEERTSLKVHKPNDPLLSIVKGAGIILDNYEQMKTVCVV